MKRFTWVVLLLIMLCAAAQAQTPPAPAPSAAGAQATPPVPGTKVAVMNFQEALFDSDAGKAAVAQIDKGLEELKTNFEKLQKELTDLQLKMQNAKTDAEKAPLNKDIDNRTTELKRIQEDAQRKSADLQDKFLPGVATLINKTVDEYARENNLVVVIDPTTDPSNIVFANKAADITTEIIRRMNAAYAKDKSIIAPAAASPAAAPAPAKQP